MRVLERIRVAVDVGGDEVRWLANRNPYAPFVVTLIFLIRLINGVNHSRSPKTIRAAVTWSDIEVKGSCGLVCTTSRSGMERLALDMARWDGNDVKPTMEQVLISFNGAIRILIRPIPAAICPRKYSPTALSHLTIR
jgi:hypothetical protein